MTISRTAIVAVLAAGVLAFSSSYPSMSANEALLASSLQWKPCSDVPSVECGSLEVPVDWQNPGGEKIKLALDRHLASDRAHRIGTLLLEPGGPGDAGLGLVKQAAQRYSPEVTARFDIVAYDPRGIDQSNSVECDPSKDDPAMPDFPQDRASFERLVTRNRAVGESCQARTGKLLRHLDSREVARDVDAIREALGEAKLNLLGFSYGTLVGTAFAEQFPNHIRAMALDGALNHSLSDTTMLATEAAAAESGFDRFVQWCSSDQSCALYSENVADVYDQLVSQADQVPIGTSDPSRKVSGDEIRHKIQGMLARGKSGWLDLAEALKKAQAGDASTFMTAPSGSASYRYSNWAITCLEFGGGSLSYGELATRELLARSVSPHLGGAVQAWDVIAQCVDWPVPKTNPPHRPVFHNLPRVLIINSTHDPATSYAWAQGLAEQMPGSVLLTRDGDGHMSYRNPGCARATIDRYLLDLTLPASATVCPN